MPCEGEVARAPRIRKVQDRHHDPREQDKTGKKIAFSPPGSHHGRAKKRNLAPVKRKTSKAHAVCTSNDVQNPVSWSDPAKPTKHREEFEEEPRQKIVEKRPKDDVNEPAHA